MKFYESRGCDEREKSHRAATRASRSKHGFTRLVCYTRYDSADRTVIILRCSGTDKVCAPFEATRIVAIYKSPTVVPGTLLHESDVFTSNNSTATARGTRSAAA